MELKKHIFKYSNIDSFIPYYEIVGKKDGPTIFLSAGMHGDEINGVYIIGEFLKWINSEVDLNELSGRILILPILNILAFEHGKRVSPIDGKDLNRQFGEDEVQTFTEYLASEIMNEFLLKAELGVDLHDSGSIAQFIPHSRIHKDDSLDCISCSRNLAKIFGTKYILERAGEERMMAVTMNSKFDIPVITVEIGGLKKIHPDSKSIGLNGMKNVLVANRMVKGDLKIPEKQIVITERDLHRSNYSGYVDLTIGLGDEVKKDDVIGKGYDPLVNEWKDILAISDGSVFSLWNNNQISSQSPLYSLVNESYFTV